MFIPSKVLWVTSLVNSSGITVKRSNKIVTEAKIPTHKAIVRMGEIAAKTGIIAIPKAKEL